MAKIYTLLRVDYDEDGNRETTLTSYRKKADADKAFHEKATEILNNIENDKGIDIVEYDPDNSNYDYEGEWVFTLDDTSFEVYIDGYYNTTAATLTIIETELN